MVLSSIDLAWICPVNGLLDLGFCVSLNHIDFFLGSLLNLKDILLSASLDFWDFFLHEDEVVVDDVQRISKATFLSIFAISCNPKMTLIVFWTLSIMIKSVLGYICFSLLESIKLMITQSDSLFVSMWILYHQGSSTSSLDTLCRWHRRWNEQIAWYSLSSHI